MIQNHQGKFVFTPTFKPNLTRNMCVSYRERKTQWSRPEIIGFVVNSRCLNLCISKFSFLWSLPTRLVYNWWLFLLYSADAIGACERERDGEWEWEGKERKGGQVKVCALASCAFSTFSTYIIFRSQEKNNVKWQRQASTSLPQRYVAMRYVRGLWRINQSRNTARLYNYAACCSRVCLCVYTTIHAYQHHEIHLWMYVCTYSIVAATKGLKLCLKSRSVISCAPIAILSHHSWGCVTHTLTHRATNPRI